MVAVARLNAHSLFMRHELNNTLQVAITNLEILHVNFGGNPNAILRVRTCLEALERTLALVATLPDEPAPTMGRRQLRIILSEDEALIRMVTASLLSDLGNEVVEVGTARAALAAIDASTDLLITDLNLPDMNGEELAAAARDKHPGLAIVIATGEDARTGASTATRHVWLQKPFNAGQLREAMKAALIQA